MEVVSQLWIHTAKGRLGFDCQVFHISIPRQRRQIQRIQVQIQIPGAQTIQPHALAATFVHTRGGWNNFLLDGALELEAILH